MNRLIKIAIFIFQAGSTFLVLFFLYMVYALLDYQGGIDNFIGITILQPILATLISGITITISFFLGLPIRLHKTINRWWRTKFYIALIISFTGIILVILSMVPDLAYRTFYISDGEKFISTIPNPYLSVSGFFATAFGVLHLYPPYTFQERMEKLFNKH